MSYFKDRPILRELPYHPTICSEKSYNKLKPVLISSIYCIRRQIDEGRRKSAK